MDCSKEPTPTMPKIERASLLTLESYARERSAFRSRVMLHKLDRVVHLGEHVRLVFEDELTMRYQVQEMLRVERIFEEAGIQEELDVYNPLIPDGRNFKCTMMIEYPDVAERRERLAELKGVERHVWVLAEGRERVYAIADEDLERETEDKTSSVHFLRFEIADEMAQALKRGAGLAIGVDHPRYTAAVDPVPSRIRNSLVGDLA